MTHTTVVTTVVVKAVFAKTTVLLPVNGASNHNKAVMNMAVAMAEISLQALMRHQYHRSR